MPSDQPIASLRLRAQDSSALAVYINDLRVANRLKQRLLAMGLGRAQNPGKMYTLGNLSVSLAWRKRVDCSSPPLPKTPGYAWARLHLQPPRIFCNCGVVEKGGSCLTCYSQTRWPRLGFQALEAVTGCLALASTAPAGGGHTMYCGAWRQNAMRRGMQLASTCASAGLAVVICRETCSVVPSSPSGRLQGWID